MRRYGVTASRLPGIIIFVLTLLTSCVPIQPGGVVEGPAASPNASMIGVDSRLSTLEVQVNSLSTRVAQLEASLATATIDSNSAQQPTSKFDALKPTTSATPVVESTTPTTEDNDSSDFKIVSIDTRVTERNDIWWKYAWILQVSNQGSHDIVFNAEIQFQDADGFVIDSSMAYGLIADAGKTSKFSDFVLINMPGARSVDNVYVQTSAVR